MFPSVTNLPPSNRYILTHNAEGKSVVHSSPPFIFTPNSIRSNPLTLTSPPLVATAAVPAHLKDDTDLSAYLAKEGDTSYTGRDIVVPTLRGANLVVFDLGAGKSSMMHRTVSIDYVICTHGHVRMETDTGAMLHLFPGDHVIQRGTMHKWHNGSETEAARLIGVTLPCEAFEIPGTGKMLAEEHIAGSEAKDWDISKM
ncbi:hypothetical protein EJ02DRAFT_405858 [Clathrospora elynae]|uniref:Cupin 2 conserved barrel domain-containing protein n=1 Tax=Clathrospora elynae TaxID=706981 RepID=A0A6A5SJJ4_9PLEO|nr:hypothetical protein EJ02DRAFT_405858 [Clathrospora elynae]